ncbi:SLAM family member 6 isoform X2 [Erinaceus europaeus]|uniref:SLAM family member 6 isoform X2 n=1 Tax=Erinaceus europaeus TaxID=9365 RepID=A0ABM3XXV2_ERIEU|nr:SLAM family member 6 isoform X2 [Erinaceus europaeus]
MAQLLLFLILLLRLETGTTVSQTISTRLDVVGTLGKSVILPLRIPEGVEFTSVAWLHNHTSTIAILYINPAQGSQFYVVDPVWQGRLELIQPYSLQLSNLTWKDMGSYSAQINIKNSKLFFNYFLLIFKQLGDLQVTHNVRWTENSTCKVHLACSVVDPGDNVMLQWQVPGNTSEVNLTLSWDRRKWSEENYTCTASNPVSNVSSSVSLRVLCTELHPDQNSTQNIIWVVFIIFIIIITMTITITVICCHKRKKRQVTVNNTEYSLTSPGSTVYAQVTHPIRAMRTPPPMKKEDSSTIYSTVQQSNENKPISPKATALNNVN